MKNAEKQIKWESYEDMRKRVKAEEAKKKVKMDEDCGGIKPYDPIKPSDKQKK